MAASASHLFMKTGNGIETSGFAVGGIERTTKNKSCFKDSTLKRVMANSYNNRIITRNGQHISDC